MLSLLKNFDLKITPVEQPDMTQKKQESNASSDMNSGKRVGFAGSIISLLFLFLAISLQVFWFENTDSTQITIIIVATFASIIAMLSGFSWDEVKDAILHGCQIAMFPMLILMMVGVLIASWLASGTIPALIYYGIQILSPDYFLFTACLICCIGSLSTGSSWTTAATFGVGFMGIGVALGISPAVTAGAVISGSIFGDKMSPLSDSTNLAAAVAEADLFTHIKSMVYSTGPAIIITLLIYLAMSFSGQGSAEVDDTQVQNILRAINDEFSLNLIVFLPPVMVFVLIALKVNGLAVMVLSSLIGTLIAMLLQGHNFGDMLTYMNYGFVVETGVENIDSVLSGGGLQNMLWTVSLGFVALAMGGIFEKTGMLESVLEKMTMLVHSMRGLVTTHVISSFIINIFSASQFMAVIIPTRMLSGIYKKQGLAPHVCSRVSEDSATVTSPLVPWGLGGVYYSSVLGVSTLDYLPYTFLALVAPLVTLTLAYSDTFMFRIQQSQN
jgi:NhaC family Na+:H+ antiporter